VAPASTDADKVPPVVGLFVRQLLVANKAVGLYPPGSTIPRETAEDTVRILDDVLERYAEVTIGVTKLGVFFDEMQIFPGQPAFAAFAVELYHRRLAAVRFHAGVTYRDILSFLTILKEPPDDIAAGGGFEAQLWDQGVGAITVVETIVTVVDATVDAADSAEHVEAQEDVGDAQTRAKRRLAALPRLRERIDIAHLVGDPAATADYLRAKTDAEGVALGVSDSARRFSEIARLVAEVEPAEGDNLVRSLAEALWELEPDMRYELLVERLLPEARFSEPLSAAVRQLDLEDVCRILATGTGPEDLSREGLSRALRNLAQISQVDSERFTKAADAALLASGMDEEKAGDVIARALPRHLLLRRAPVSKELGAPGAAVIKLIGEAPVHLGQHQDDEEVVQLVQEAERGVTNGQVIDVLVTLLMFDLREAQFASTMSALEDQLGVLVIRGEIDASADAALLLLHAAKDPHLSPEQRLRLERAVARFTRPEDMRAITQALWIFRPGEPEHDAAERLLQTLGALAIPPILEMLSDEPDRVIRKALVDLLSRDASKYVVEIGSHISDSRWYFVRNVVAILGSTHSHSVLLYLERTLDHKDVRVRRETIRALSSVGDRRAMELLTLALGDDDAQNVQLAARYLGLRGELGAVSALAALARGESRGNRETGPRVEAIEALGRIGTPEALPTLTALSRKRSLLGSARYREIRAAASAAIDAIQRSLEAGGAQ
jgi:HEAT repeat protein